MIIEMKNVSYVRDSRYLLRDIDWSVAAGEHWAILGLNGSGKTTLLNMVNGYLFPSKGEMSVLGMEFGKADLRELRKHIGWVSTALQEKLYGSETALEIVVSGKYATIGLFGMPMPEDNERALSLLVQLGCGELANRKYQTLSQGEKQKVLIARGMMAAPRLLILDEPCTGLDIFAKERLLNDLEKLSSTEDTPTFIYVTHRAEDILPIFTKTLLLKEGSLYASGKTGDLLTSEVLSGFFGAPVKLKWSGRRVSLRIGNFA